MKKPKAKKSGGLRAFAKRVKAKASKCTGPSKRTPAQRAAIDKRAVVATNAQRKADRAERNLSRVERALTVPCPTCLAAKGVQCFDRQGRQVPTPHRLRLQAGDKPALSSLAGALGPLVVATASNKGRDSWAKPGTEREKIDAQRLKSFGVTHYPPHPDLIDPAQIIIGKRHREDFGDLRALAQSINDRGGLLQPVALTARRELIAGERRIRAWGMSRFAGELIPVHYLDVDAIVRGEWDENAQRKDFTPSEAVKIKRTLESVLATIAAAPVPGKRGRPATGNVSDKVGKLTGVKRESLRKAEAVVEAAEREPERYGDLVEQMDKSGSVNAAHKKLQVRAAKKNLDDAPPVLPMNAADCATWSIDFPWAAEMEGDQAKIDAAGRAFRPYPEMKIKTACAFAHDEIAPKLPAVVSVWLWVTNFILVRGYHGHIIAALGFKPESACTMLTWDKVDLGRGQVLREQTEHAILLTRGKPLIDVFGENPPTTLIREPRRENSRKPEAFYRLAERVTPAKRYAAIFSQGGEGDLWDGHGDQVGKFAAETSPAATPDGAAADAEGYNEVQVAAANMKPGAIVTPVEPAEPIADLPPAAAFDVAAEREALAAIAAGQTPAREDAALILARRGLAHAGVKSLRLTNLGADRLATLNARDGAAEADEAPAPRQIDIEEAIAAKAADDLEIPDFLRRGAAA